MLTASNLTTGLLGFIFSMYLSKVLGPEGMGLYGIIMPIYNLFISIMTAGIIASISKITAVYSARDDYKNIIRTMKVVAIFNFIWCLIIGIFVFFLSPIIGHFWAKDPRIIIFLWNFKNHSSFFYRYFRKIFAHLCFSYTHFHI